jgi:predicted oxidoreductase
LIDQPLAAPPALRPLGPDGPALAPLAWGMWRFAGHSVDAARAMIDAAFDIGVTLFDTADIYGFGEQGFGAAEALLGEVFAADSSLRGRMVLATKGGITPPTPYDSSRAWLTQAIDDSLRRLRTDHVDLWQVHRPDILTHPDEVARTLEDAHRAGKIGAVGVSNYTPAQIDALRAALTIPLVSTQPELSPLCLDPITDGSLDRAMQHGTTVFAWSPLGGGRIANPETPREVAVAAALDAVAAEQGVSRATAAFGWIMAHPAHPIPIIGSQNPARIREVGGALTMKWTRADWYAVLVASRGEGLP